jgi:hypothetical protein
VAGRDMLEALSVDICVYDLVTEGVMIIGSIFQEVEMVLVGPGWSALRQVFFKVSTSH